MKKVISHGCQKMELLVWATPSLSAYIKDKSYHVSGQQSPHLCNKNIVLSHIKSVL